MKRPREGGNSCRVWRGRDGMLWEGLGEYYG